MIIIIIIIITICCSFSWDFIIMVIMFLFQVIEVNNINVEGQTPNHVLNILREAEHTITFKLIPNVGEYYSLSNHHSDDDDNDENTVTFKLRRTKCWLVISVHHDS